MKGSDTGRGAASAPHRSRQAWPAELRLHLAQVIVDRGVASATLSKTLGISLNTLQDWASCYRRRSTREGTRPAGLL